MLTININNSETGPVSSTDPQRVEVYIGAMDSYEFFDLGGIRWKLPTAMVEDLIKAHQNKHVTTKE